MSDQSTPGHEREGAREGEMGRVRKGVVMWKERRRVRGE